MIVFIHGWGFDNSVFKEDGIKLSLPGHENQIKSLEEASLEYAKTLKEHKSLEIVGWSMGASLGIILTKHLDNIKSLKLIGFSPYFKKAHEESTFLAFIRRMKKDFISGVDEFRKNAYQEPFSGPYPDKNIAINILYEYQNLDLRDYIKSLKIPIYILQGKNDTITPLEEAYKSKQLNNSITILEYEGGHFPNYKILKSFIHLW